MSADGSSVGSQSKQGWRTRALRQAAWRVLLRAGRWSGKCDLDATSSLDRPQSAVLRHFIPGATELKLLSLSASQRHVLQDMLSAILENSGGFLLTGEAGSGKSRVANQLGVHLAAAGHSAATIDGREIVAAEIGVPFLERQLTGSPLPPDRALVLIVDAAEMLDRRTLHRLLSWLAMALSRGDLLRLMLVGRPAIRELIDQADERLGREEIPWRFELAPVSAASETTRHRPLRSPLRQSTSWTWAIARSMRYAVATLAAIVLLWTIVSLFGPGANKTSGPGSTVQFTENKDAPAASHTAPLPHSVVPDAPPATAEKEKAAPLDRIEPLAGPPASVPAAPTVPDTLGSKNQPSNDAVGPVAPPTSPAPTPQQGLASRSAPPAKPPSHSARSLEDKGRADTHRSPPANRTGSAPKQPPKAQLALRAPSASDRSPAQSDGHIGPVAEIPAAESGPPCQPYVSSANYIGTAVHVSGMACHDGNGHWWLMNQQE